MQTQLCCIHMTTCSWMRQMAILYVLIVITSRAYVHLAQKVPPRFLKPAVCKYPTTVNKSEICILLLKPYSLMWHLVCGNRVRNGRDRRPETRRMSSPTVALFKVCGTTQSTVESMMTWMMSTAFRCSRNRLSSRHPLCWFNEYVHVHVW